MKTTLTRRLGAVAAAVATSAVLLTAAPAAQAADRGIYSAADGSITFFEGAKTTITPIVLGIRWSQTRTLGWPTTSSFGLKESGLGQHFEMGSIYFSPASGAWDIRQPFLSGYAASNWENGALGYPTGTPINIRSGAFQPFQRGNVYWSQATGAQGVGGAIFAKYGNYGWENGRLGLPTSSEIGIKGGAFNRFQGGNVYWSPAGGAHPVFGALFTKWGQTGWENGRHGYPTSDEIGPLRNGGYGQHFSNGSSIYWSQATGARSVFGALREAYGNQGWEGGRLGYPTSDEYSVDGGASIRQNFQGGSLTYTFATGKVS